MNASIYRSEYYVEKRTGTFADNLVAFGLAYVLDGITNSRARVTIADHGSHFAVICDPPLREDLVKNCQFFTGAFLLVTVDGKTQQRVIKGTRLSLDDIEAMVGVVEDYEQAKADNETYWKWRKSVGGQYLKRNPPVEPHRDWELFRAINPTALQAANSAAAEWFQGRVAFPALLETVLIYASTLPNDQEGAEKHWAAVCKLHGLHHTKQLSASQVINPTQGKGTANGKAIFAKPGNLRNFWLTEYLKWVGLRWAGFTRLIRDSKDRKIYVLAPNRLDWHDHHGIREEFRRLMVGSGGAIQLDVLAALNYTKAILNYTAVKDDESLFVQIFGSHQGVNRLVYGLDSAYYKNLGQSAAVMNIARIGLPAWVQPRVRQDIQLYQSMIDEHIRIVRNLDEKRGEEYELLRLYRDFLSTNELTALLAFTDAYSGFVIQRDKLAPQFTVHHLEVIMSSIAPPLSKITQSRGFRNLAYAIRMATVEAHRRNQKRNQGKYDVSYEVRYGLGQELLRKSAYPNEFITALSEFIHDYNAENARMRERLERQGHSQPRGARSDVSIKDIDELLALMDEYRDPQMIASLLVAYGYASTFQRDETYTPDSDAEEVTDSVSNDGDDASPEEE
ncbi:hypothetical protein [Chloroflexus sp.]|uniref:hypothetical protein n=1 Tax=Chloroflexus sp. TaxID=1904827 RepID=UPI002ADE3BFC|nr:hypothetical protein [Chloroflexus sp.]